jgi:hypothetical protein
MAMSKEDFIALAAIVSDVAASHRYFKTDPQAIIDTLARDLANFCANRNPNFDRSRFLSACGVKHD